MNRFFGHSSATVSREIELFAFVFLLLLPSPSMCKAHYPVDRTQGQGKMWVGWSTAEREHFILGYLWAYHSGFSSGCVTYFENNSTEIGSALTNSPLQKCKTQELSYSNEASYYEHAITTYYQKYPKDLDIPVSWLMIAFSDTENKRAADIHMAWNRKHSHP